MGWPDLKRRPPHPQPGALPGCATSRNLSNYYSDVVRLILYRYEFFDKKDFNLLEKSLIQDFGIQRPKIAVLGINPHTGDNGVIGEEDDTLLTPVIKKWNEKGSLVFGPYPADGFFGNQSYSKFDAVLATYHDQGLIPFKTLSFGQGVNFTAGLSHVRTSPDHGTAFDVAGKGVADPSSFSEAVYRAREIFLKRNEKFS